MVYPHILERRFATINGLLLFALFSVLWLKSWVEGDAGLASMIYWPGAYVVGLGILSFLIPIVFNTVRPSGVMATLGIHAPSSLIFGILHFVLTGFITLIFERFFGLPEHYTFSSLVSHWLNHWTGMLDGVLWYWLYYGLLFGLRQGQALEHERMRHAEAKHGLVTSNLSALASELNPHFIFNALNNIVMTIRLNENRKAVTMINALTEMFRAVLKKDGTSKVPLHQEIALLEKYVSLEQEFHEEQVQIDLEFSDETQEALVPQMLLQPLVENALKHGVDLSMEEQKVRVGSYKEKEELILEVFNTKSHDMPPMDLSDTKGMGLHHTIHRLRQTYQASFQFQTMDLADGTLFKITLPFKTS